MRYTTVAIMGLCVILSGCGRQEPTKPQVTFKGATIDPAKGNNSENNLKNLVMGLLMYCQDYDETMPPAMDPASAQQYLNPYTKNPVLWVDPRTQQIYGTNPSLAGRSLVSVVSPEQIAVFYETVPRQQEFRAAVFLDGHVGEIPESQWPQVRQFSGIP